MTSARVENAVDTSWRALSVMQLPILSFPFPRSLKTTSASLRPCDCSKREIRVSLFLSLHSHIVNAASGLFSYRSTFSLRNSFIFFLFLSFSRSVLAHPRPSRSLFTLFDAMTRIYILRIIIQKRLCVFYFFFLFACDLICLQRGNSPYETTTQKKTSNK